MASIGVVAAFAVRDGNAEHLAGLAGGRERRFGVLDAQVHPLAAVLERVVAHERAGKEVGLAEDLEAVADADDGLAGLGVPDDGLHDGREAGDGAGAQVVAVGEATGEDDAVVGGEIALAVPDEVGLLTGDRE